MIELIIDNSGTCWRRCKNGKLVAVEFDDDVAGLLLDAASSQSEQVMRDYYSDYYFGD